MTSWHVRHRRAGGECGPAARTLVRYMHGVHSGDWSGVMRSNTATVGRRNQK
eukprot:CAMPEP_0181236210 /NCGR_PEP_ID=MMETSP1096-20121128/38048_1 /TAXON_ID=156174 ORGANISM="Chrysochromulina ericina, Strain CCMP281" /NCGR_SAMPLE_ID=MMETSP1096 /ASSEMBLY_ACC=CAM_ASM_000453 /LENGTH=51 /DNA_ID=CAMNT_0023331363 /DNA_START=211 /DNA_END=363 /DNA_ORIENTATION=-